MQPKDEHELSKLTGDEMDAEYRKRTLDGLEPLNEQGPSCAITMPLSGDSAHLLTSDGARRCIVARGYALGCRGISIIIKLDISTHSSDWSIGSPVARVQLAAVPSTPSSDPFDEDKIDIIKRAARDTGSWSDAHRLEKEDGVYIDGRRLPGSRNNSLDARPQCAKGKSWAWCLWEAVIELPDDIKSFALVARVGAS